MSVQGLLPPKRPPYAKEAKGPARPSTSENSGTAQTHYTLLEGLQIASSGNDPSSTTVICPISILTCDDGSLSEYLLAIREAVNRTEPVIVHKKRKAMSRSQQEALNEAIRTHLRCLGQAIAILKFHIEEMDDRLCHLRRNEITLMQYYADLDDDIEHGKMGMLHRNTPYHRQVRAQRRAAPQQHYSSESEMLETRLAHVQQVLKEMADKERDLRPPDSDDSFARIRTPNDMTGCLDDGKFEDDYDEALGKKNSPEVHLLLRALRPLWRRVQATRVEPSLPPSSVESWLRKDLILPFSARVLALKMDEAGNAGDRFVEWYVNIILDPLAMTQLVELMPREYLVTTTARLASACNMSLQLQQSQALPDVSHVVLQAIADGRSDVLASLVLSPSGSFLRALDSDEHTIIIFFAAILTGQIEVLRRLISAGFFSSKGLIVWLFLNPNADDPSYKDFVSQILTSVQRYVSLDPSLTDMNRSDTTHSDTPDNTYRVRHYNTVGGTSASFLGGLVENLRRFLLDYASWKGSRANSAIHRLGKNAEQNAKRPLGGTQLGDSNPRDSPSRRRERVSTVSFSDMLVKRRFDRLLFSQAKCAGLPVVSTLWMRRVDAWGYIPLEGTKEYLLLLGDTSTINAHIVQMPPEYAMGWKDTCDGQKSMRESTDRSPELRGLKSGMSQKNPGKNNKLHGQDQQGMNRSFYYEAHISIPFLLGDVPLNSESFEAVLSKSDECRALQETSVYVGWCSEEKVPLADGKTLGPPLGSDIHSIGISFDILHRGRLRDGGEQIIIRPMRHAKGQSSAFFEKDESHHEEVGSSSISEKKATLLEMRFDTFGSDSSCDAELSVRVLQTQISQTFGSDVSMSRRSAKRNRVLPRVNSYDALSDAQETAFSTEPRKATLSCAAFSQSSMVVKGPSVYGSLVLVVGCKVNFDTKCASFMVNGKDLGDAFTSLPSPDALRPAMTLRASKKIVTALQQANPSDSAVVRFTFSSETLMDRPCIGSHTSPTSTAPQCKKSFSSALIKKRGPVRGVANVIPGADNSTSLIFDDVMMQCAFIRLFTQAETSMEGGVDEILSKADALALGKSVIGVTERRVRDLLNTPTSLESLLFFPPVHVRRRSDDVDKESIGVTIIPADALLAPLCAALALRQRIAAYHIAIHPLTDFHSSDEMSVRQRRMALLAAATLGYEEVLYILLERMCIFEVLAVFTLKKTEDQTTIDNSTDRDNVKSRVRSPIASDSMKRFFASVSLLHRVEYTPLHCALLEGHESCAHLLLYYLDKRLLDEHKRHAVNVLTRSGETALVMACKDGRSSIAKRLLAMGASPSSFDRVSRANCLELSCASGSEEIAMALLETSDYRMSKAVNHVGSASPLCWCALNNIGSLVKPLLQNGANPNMTLEGPTPLLLAVTFGSAEAALQLLEWCEPIVSDTHSLSNSCVNESDEANQKKSEDPLKGRCYIVIPSYTKQTFGSLYIDALDPRSQCTALHMACELGQLEVVRALMENGASLNLHNKSTISNPLQIAIMNGHENMALEILEHAKDKLRRGFNVLDIAAIDKHGDTALHLAASEGMLPVIEYIMSQFSDDEITRLSTIRNFTRRPNSVSLTASNRKGRTPLLMAIYAHKEEAAQLIASLTPNALPNPGGPLVDGTCMALLISDSEGLDNVTLFLLSRASYPATSSFRENFFTRYNTKRVKIDQQENLSEPLVRSARESVHRTSFRSGLAARGIMRARRKLSPRVRCGTDLSGGLMCRASITLSASVGGGISLLGKNSIVVSRRKLSSRLSSSNIVSQRRRSSYVQMLLAKGVNVPSTRKVLHCLLRGFAVEELYAMLDVIFTETSRAAQSRVAMKYAELIIGFLIDHSGIYIASSDALHFARKMYTMPMIAEVVNSTELAAAKKKLSEMRPFCYELFSLVRTRSHHDMCIDDMRHLVEQHGKSGSSLTEDLTSPFGFTLLQLAASLELPGVSEFLLGECRMDSLYVSPTCEEIRAPFINSTLTDDRGLTTAKWLLTPFRLALISRNRETLDVFLPENITDDAAEALLEFRESPLADPLQQTALQEVLHQPLDDIPEATAIATMGIARQLLRQGAIVHGNVNADGNDAWMLAVRSSPGKGTVLDLFFEEDVEMDEESENGDDDDDDDDEGKGETEEYILDTENITSEALPPNPSSTQSLNDDSSDHTMNNFDNVRLELPKFDQSVSATKLHLSFKHRTGLFECNRSVYNAQLVFLCAEHNPCHLLALLERYGAVLSPSVVHPRSGETLLMYLLGKAVSLYESTEDTFNDINVANSEIKVSTEAEVRPLLSMYHSPEHPVSHSPESVNESIPYRDPLQIPAVFTLLSVVERMLEKFYFQNLYHPRGDGETALSLAARLSNTKIVSLIVRPVHAGYKTRGFGSSAEEKDKASESQKAVDTINTGLTQSLLLTNCWSTLAKRLYYPENELETILTISRHILDVNTRLSFLSIVYSNLHPILALRVAGHFASDAKKFLMRPEAANAFWCNVLYAQFTGRLDDVSMTASQWNSILIVLLPVAPAVAFYLIKTTPEFANLQRRHTPLREPAASPLVRRGSRKLNNWNEILKRTGAYLRQLATASASVLGPHTLNQQNISSGQRQAFASMTSLFHEIIELTVRFDNASLLMDLLTATSEQLKDCLQQEFRCLMEEHHLEVIAISAGSVNVLKLLASTPEASAYMSYERYDRIDPITGFPEDLPRNDASGADSPSTASVTSLRRGVDKPVNVSRRSINTAPNPISFRGGLVLPESLAQLQASKLRPKSSVSTNTAPVESAEPTQLLESTRVEDTALGETVMQYIEVLSAARERTTPSAITWGVGAAARPVALQKGLEVKIIDAQAENFHNVAAPVSLSRGRAIIQFSEHSRTPSGNRGSTSMSHKRQSEVLISPVPTSHSSSLKPLKGSALPPLRSSPFSKRSDGKPVDSLEETRLGVLGNTSPSTEQIRYFAHYLCDWALHSTLVLHAPNPSVRTIETILYLLDLRAPLTLAAVQIFFAASRPSNNWVSSSGEKLSFTYTTRTHKDTLLHLLVQRDQLQLTRYFLATALFYFTRYQYDAPCDMPPKFSLLDFPVKLADNQPNSAARPCGTPRIEKTKRDNQQDDGDDEGPSYPSVFLRCMLRTNKYGLTPFDYARGPMVSLLMDYGCVPPSYRPNPMGFCTSTRLPSVKSAPPWHAFQSVPRLLLVSHSLIGLRDNNKENKLMSGTVPAGETGAHAGNARITDATIARNQVLSQRSTRAAGLEALPTDDVSLLHLGLCSAEDELVLQKIMLNREKQLALLSSGNHADWKLSSIMPPEVPEPPTTASTQKPTTPQSRPKSKGRGAKISSARSSEKESPSALGLLNVLRDRGLVAFPLVLPLNEIGDSERRVDALHSETAILISMTPMMLAQSAGVVRRDEPSAQPASTSKKHMASSIPPRFVVTDKSSSPAELLEAWITTRRVKPSGKDPNMQCLLKALSSGAAGNNIRALSLIIAPSYETKR